ncbi:hypothetical protein NF27_DO00060 [Candidatus Jidaibacter acanthamoeba]|uniref:Uncharacterized protein n=1 Tax=Candidatus Jidaibacter acanthamoebae TaxID=86105 RepID=A0A0C1QJI6_9RICK|nr:hypothetical protein NF27_DO00060 [Candidatus Jidaibacter acanthamoeba]
MIISSKLLYIFVMLKHNKNINYAITMRDYKPGYSASKVNYSYRFTNTASDVFRIVDNLENDMRDSKKESITPAIKQFLFKNLTEIINSSRAGDRHNFKISLDTCLGRSDIRDSVKLIILHKLYIFLKQKNNIFARNVDQYYENLVSKKIEIYTRRESEHDIIELNIFLPLVRTLKKVLNQAELSAPTTEYLNKICKEILCMRTTAGINSNYCNSQCADYLLDIFQLNPSLYEKRANAIEIISKLFERELLLNFQQKLSCIYTLSGSLIVYLGILNVKTDTGIYEEVHLCSRAIISYLYNNDRYKCVGSKGDFLSPADAVIRLRKLCNDKPLLSYDDSLHKILDKIHSFFKSQGHTSIFDLTRRVVAKAEELYNSNNDTYKERYSNNDSLPFSYTQQITAQRENRTQDSRRYY